MNLKKMIKVSDAVMTSKEQERQFLKNGTITKRKLQQLIEDFDVSEIPVNIVSGEDYDYSNIEWERIGAGVSINDKYYIYLGMKYAGYIDTETGEVSLDADDGGLAVHENEKEIFAEEAYYGFMDNQFNDFLEAIRVKFEQYVKNNKAYKKYFKK